MKDALTGTWWGALAGGAAGVSTFTILGWLGFPEPSPGVWVVTGFVGGWQMNTWRRTHG